MKLTIGQLKALIAPMDDNGLVLGRDRDCIMLDMIDIVGHPTHPADPDNRIAGICYHASIETVYGGDRPEPEWQGKQLIIFCDCD